MSKLLTGNWVAALKSRDWKKTALREGGANGRCGGKGEDKD